VHGCGNADLRVRQRCRTLHAGSVRSPIREIRGHDLPPSLAFSLRGASSLGMMQMHAGDH
jgi:hypothetical protein